ncbi:MAG TPA: hypothetical protein VG755_09360 [Nannocystaceae bacterium]|nr:hypothetical protein [Nannocystaceae bacterium]
MLAIAFACTGCGPKVGETEDGGGSESVESEGGGSSEESTVSGPSTSTGPTTTTTNADDATTDTPQPLDVGSTVPDVTGTHLFAVAAVIDPSHPLQWFATVSEGGQPGGLTIELQSLSLDQAATTTPREPVGEARVIDVVVEADGSFTVEVPDMLIPGAANPITGSDIVGTIILDGRVVSDDLLCGNVTGTITQPLMLDLTGSTFAGTRVPDISQLPGDPIPAACP